MSTVRCLIPVSVRLSRHIGSAELAALEDAVAAAVSRQLRSVRGRLGLAAGVASRYLAPEPVSFRGTTARLDQRGVSAAIQRSITRAVAASGGTLEPRSGGSRLEKPTSSPRTRRHELLEALAPVRRRRDQGRFDPIHHDAAGAPPDRPAADVLRSPTLQDQLLTQDGPLEGLLVAILPGRQPLWVGPGRAIIAANLSRAVTWGQLLFGARGFAVFEGGGGFHAVTMTRVVHDTDFGADFGAMPRSGPEDPTMAAPGAVRWRDVLVSDHDYDLRVLVTAEGTCLFPPGGDQRERFARELESTPAADRTVTASALRAFEEIDASRGNHAVATAARLSGLPGVAAFALVPWHIKIRCLEAILAAWSGAGALVVLEIITSLDSTAELTTVLELVRATGRLDDLFEHIEPQVWDLLSWAGANFCQPLELTFERSVAALQDSGLLPGSTSEAAARVTRAEHGPTLSPGALAEIEEAVSRFVHSGGTSTNLGFLTARPAGAGDGIRSIVQLTAAYHLALVGHTPSARILTALLAEVSRPLPAALAGIEMLGVAERFGPRVRSALVLDLASRFRVLGDAKAIVDDAGAGDQAVSLVRLRRLMTSGGEPEASGSLE